MKDGYTGYYCPDCDKYIPYAISFPFMYTKVDKIVKDGAHDWKK